MILTHLVLFGFFGGASDATGGVFQVAWASGINAVIGAGRIG